MAPALQNPRGAAASASPKVKTVFYIAMENHNFTQPITDPPSAPLQLRGARAAPYLNSLITPGHQNARQVSLASAYHNILNLHPSEPNYVWQEAGLRGPPVSDADADPFPNNIVDAPNFRALLQSAGISWKSYQEDIDLKKKVPSMNDTSCDAVRKGERTNEVLPEDQWTVPLCSIQDSSDAYTNPYNGSHYYSFTPKHEGALFFLATNGCENYTPSNPQAKYYAPLQQLELDLQNNKVAPYNWITPNNYNNQHTPLRDGFTYKSEFFKGGEHSFQGDEAAIAQGDNFLSIIIPKIMDSQAYRDNGAIIIWYDETEGDGRDNPDHTLAEIVISPLAKGNAYANGLPYTHSSDLKTMQLLFDVYPPEGGFLGDANTQGTYDLSDLFQPGAIPVPDPSSPGRHSRKP
jgi:hypothetical protein